ncbi:insulinase family protein [Candidatus Sulfidibacterium hydrothermale]|uniref:M16 family metallopeptidase n=1 Tax=Candidatus Sulfidibacterium hydrothermale TaxID=2875962 RepID=UPI001F0A6BE3|nr:pitrilysin family protein [Candidatus Sulfidibacterium hydrothermale]UBM62431.1 insulinase family protein [Candidatus Sulfidibacterium hydrothermale]
MKKILIALLAFFIVSPMMAHQTGVQKNEETVLRHTLKNGLRVVIIRNPLAPVVTTEINYLVGSNEAPKGFPGMAHAQEHMMFRGSPELSADQLADISAAMGGDFNADTRQMVTQYFFTVPTEDLDIALHIGAIRMRGVLDSEKLWEKERGAIEQEVSRDLSNPQYVFYKKLLAAMFKGTPYAHDALGTKASFDKTTGTMLKKFHDSWYAPNNAILVIVGRVNPQKALTMVEKYFGDIPAKKLPPRPVIQLQPVKPDTLHLKTDLPYGLAIVSFRMPGTDSPDYAAAQVLSDVLSNHRGKLYALVPEGKALYTGFSMSGLRKAGIGFGIAVFPRGGNAEKLLQEVTSVLSSEVKNGVNPDLVKAAKLHEISSFEFQKNSVSGLANVWSEALAVEGRQSPEEDLQAIERVTVEDVNRVARKYLDMNHAIVAILTPQSSGKPISRKGFGGAESFAPKNPKPVKLPEWAEKAMGRLVVPQSIVNPTVTTLPNGIRLIVQPEHISNTVTIYGGIKNQPDLETPKGKEGVDAVLDQLFNYGSTTLNRIQFQKALDDIGANESAGSSFLLQVLSNHFERGVQLLADNEIHPALPNRAFMIIQRQTAAMVAGQLKSPDYLFSKAIKTSLLPKGDPALRHATPASVMSLKMQDVKDYYQTVFRPDLATIVVIGNITPEKAKTVIEKYFGNWKATGKKPNVEFSPVPMNKASQTHVPDVSRVQDRVALAENLELTRSNPDYYALQVGNHVLGGAFYATRLFRDLRENSGLVYYVSSSFNIGKHRSNYMVNYGCNPSNVVKAKDIVVKDLKQMQKEEVTEKELKMAKSILLRQITLSESSIDDIADGLLSRSLKDLPLNQPVIAAKHYISISAGQVKDAFTKWVHPENLIQVTLGPNPK